MGIKRMDFVLAVIALPVGALSAASAERWMDASEKGAVEIRQAKRELLASAGLLDLHNSVYSRVGPAAWENRVKPAFMMAITCETVRETGNIAPDWRDVVAWVRSNPDRARQLMKDAERSGD